MGRQAWERARRPEQKQQRREEILAAAADLFDREGIDGTTLSAIARAAGLSKANLYRYFDSREAILLAVLAEEQAHWLQAVRVRLDALKGSGDIEAVADAITEALVANPRVHGLMACVSSVLEHNVGVEAVEHLKRAALLEGLQTTEALHAALPQIPREGLMKFVKMYYLFASAVWPAAHPNEVVSQVLSRPEFQPMCIELEDALRQHARLVLRGLAAEARAD